MNGKMNIILLIFLINSIVIYSQDIIILEDEEARDNIIRISNSLNENRLREQLEIRDYSDLNGTFWVAEEPIIIDGIKYFNDGYIFLKNNWIISVSVYERLNLYFYNDERLQLSYNPYHIQFINYAIRYTIDDGNIIINDDIFAYLKNKYLYIYSIKDSAYNEDYIKFRLESRFTIDDWIDSD